jgi:arginine repressor
MASSPHERLLTVRKKIEQQRNTVESLKREGHECPDAERQLSRMLAELRAIEAPVSQSKSA